jgi:hypothetical protein
VVKRRDTEEETAEPEALWSAALQVEGVVRTEAGSEVPMFPGMF